MRTLYHLPLDAGCRLVRILLREKGLEAEFRAEKIWERREGFLHLNPAGEVPVLLEAGIEGQAEHVIAGSAKVLAEYLEDAYPERSFLGADPLQRAEVRRLMAWFDDKFNREVTLNLVEEKVHKRFTGQGEPDSRAIRAGLANMRYHLDYIGWLCDRRTWLAGDSFSLADITAGAHLSALDYLGDVPWDDHPGAKDWYARIKSRPSLRGILADSLPGLPPARHYIDLDF